MTNVHFCCEHPEAVTQICLGAFAGALFYSLHEARFHIFSHYLHILQQLAPMVQIWKEAAQFQAKRVFLEASTARFWQHIVFIVVSLKWRAFIFILEKYLDTDPFHRSSPPFHFQDIACWLFQEFQSARIFHGWIQDLTNAGRWEVSRQWSRSFSLWFFHLHHKIVNKNSTRSTVSILVQWWIFLVCRPEIFISGSFVQKYSNQGALCRNIGQW